MLFGGPWRGRATWWEYVRANLLIPCLRSKGERREERGGERKGEERREDKGEKRG